MSMLDRPRFDTVTGEPALTSSSSVESLRKSADVLLASVSKSLGASSPFESDLGCPGIHASEELPVLAICLRLLSCRESLEVVGRDPWDTLESGGTSSEWTELACDGLSRIECEWTEVARDGD